MKLFDLIKDKLKDPQGVISDNEMLLLNRRDFIYSETSSGANFLNLFHAERVTYEMYAIIDFIHSGVCKVQNTTEVRVYQLSQSMTLPSMAVSALVGDSSGGIRIYAPRGVQAVNPRDPFAGDLLLRFKANLDTGLAMGDIGQNEKAIEIIFCNASNEAEVSSALKAFERVRRGFILIKGYGRIKAPNCGEIILSARLNVHCSLAGFGICHAF